MVRTLIITFLIIVYHTTITIFIIARMLSDISYVHLFMPRPHFSNWNTSSMGAGSASPVQGLEQCPVLSRSINIYSVVADETLNSAGLK